LAIIIGHLRLYQEPTWLWSLLKLDSAGVESFALYAGGVAGIVFTAAILGLLFRRFNGIIKTISVPEDYIILALLLSIGVSGLYMRFFAGLSVPQLQQYITGLLAFRITLTPSVLNPFFVIHYLIVQSFLIYFPFSKLAHIAGSFITNYIIRR
jgi:nitrate reductase gamma subunit